MTRVSNPPPEFGNKLRIAAMKINRGGIVAYPTEAVYGLGCNPKNENALRRLLRLKNRPVEKGMILIAADFDQLKPFIDFRRIHNLQEILGTWPGPVTWVFPARTTVPRLIKGDHDSIAVRVTSHPLAASLCRTFGNALVSTSANPAGYQPARNALKVRQYFKHRDLFLLSGPTGPEKQPSSIYRAIDQFRLR